MLEAAKVCHAFAPGRPILRGVSIHVAPGEIVGLFGASGIGKTTLGRILAGRLRPQGGAVRVDGAPLPATGFRPVQYLSQHPLEDMNPRWRIGAILTEAGPRNGELEEALHLDPDWERRYPHELSGGELQRVSIARALDPRTRYLVADEISAALDPITQRAIWRALMLHAERTGLGILAISHDRALLSRIAARVETL